MREAWAHRHVKNNVATKITLALGWFVIFQFFDSYKLEIQRLKEWACRPSVYIGRNGRERTDRKFGRIFISLLLTFTLQFSDPARHRFKISSAATHFLLQTKTIVKPLLSKSW